MKNLLMTISLKYSRIIESNVNVDLRYAKEDSTDFLYLSFKIYEKQ